MFGFDAVLDMENILRKCMSSAMIEMTRNQQLAKPPSALVNVSRNGNRNILIPRCFSSSHLDNETTDGLTITATNSSNWSNNNNSRVSETTNMNDDSLTESYTSLLSSFPLPLRTMSNTSTGITTVKTSQLQTNGNGSTQSMPRKAYIRLTPHIGPAISQCFMFDIVDREIEAGGPKLKLGRCPIGDDPSNWVLFKSKVVSRSHAEIWMANDGKVYIKDLGSSSGTFLNRRRLTVSHCIADPFAHEVSDGDFIQLGVDHNKGREPQLRAARIRIEINHQGWLERLTTNNYTLDTYRQIRQQIARNSLIESLGISEGEEENTPVRKRAAACSSSSKKNPHEPFKETVQECCICLYCIAPYQALFVAPCSHVYHFKCLRPLLVKNYPAFSCPLCRTYFDLEADVDVDESELQQMLKGRMNSDSSRRKSSSNSIVSVSNLPSSLESTTITDNSPTTITKISSSQ